ncbi:MAG: hypothetical protein HKN20_12515, partial [Gemmatimonadetes bacterium]|nr:hypothetical protein [Gemmatimonadota bacterium]
LDRIVRRCLEKNPAERFQSGHDLAYALEAAIDASVSMSGGMPGEHLAGPGADFDARPAKRSARIPIVPTLAVAALAAAAGWFLGARDGGSADGGAHEAGDWSQARFVPLTFEDGVELMPALAPDGNSFVYVGVPDNGQGSDLFFRRVGGEVSLNLTNTPGLRERDPSFSPDGSQIAYAISYSGEADGIYVMGATGESRRKIIDRGGNPTWSPDGTQLAVATFSIDNPGGRPATSEVWIVDISNGEFVRRIHDGDAVQPDWSPDGSWIAFWGLPAGTGNRTLYTVPAAGGEATALNDDAHINWCPRWSADSRHLYFASDRGGTMDIWRVPIDPATGRGAGRPEAITTSPIRFAPFDLATETNRIVGTATSEKTEVVRAKLDRKNRRLVDPETIFGTGRRIWQAEISPDGEWLLMMGNDPSEDLFVCKRDGSDFRRLTNDAYKDRGPKWAGNSKTLYFFSDRDGKYRVWRMERDGSGLKQITNLSGDYTCGVPAISADGRYMTAYRVGMDGSCWFEMTGELPLTEAREFPPMPGGGLFFAQEFSPGPNKVVGFRTGDVENVREIVVFDMESQTYDPLGISGAAFWLGDHELGIQYGDSMAVFDLRTKKPEPFGIRAAGTGLASGSYCIATGEMFMRRSIVETNIWMVEAAEPEPFTPPAAPQ